MGKRIMIDLAMVGFVFWQNLRQQGFTVEVGGFDQHRWDTPGQWTGGDGCRFVHVAVGMRPGPDGPLERKVSKDLVRAHRFHHFRSVSGGGIIIQNV